MERLDEWKSVSDEVVSISKGIFEKIVSDSENREKQLGRLTRIPMKRGQFLYNGGPVVGTLDIRYTLFLVDRETQYDKLLETGALNCRSDADTGVVEINGYTYLGQCDNAMLSHIAHEVNHLYQYGKGFRKNEELYNTVVTVLLDAGVSENEKIPSYIIYYTFKHEVDSFSAQLYQQLKKGVIRNTSSLYEALCEFEPFVVLERYMDYMTEHMDEDGVRNGIAATGLTFRQWRHRAKSGINRFKRKMENAYHRFKIEQQDSNLTLEAKLQTTVNDIKQYGLLSECIENVFGI